MFSPSCSLRRRVPASILDAAENGGVLISPAIQMSGFPSFPTAIDYVVFDIESTALYGVRATPSTGRAQWGTLGRMHLLVGGLMVCRQGTRMHPAHVHIQYAFRLVDLGIECRGRPSMAEPMPEERKSGPSYRPGNAVLALRRVDRSLI